MSTVQLKRSAVAAKVPTTTDLALGELALNTFDGRLFFKKDPGTPSIITVVTTDDSQTLTSKTLSGSTLSGTVTANGSVGTAGQVLTTSATGVYWSTVSGGGGGATNLTTSANGSTITVVSDTGTDSIIPGANATIAGVLTAEAQTIGGVKTLSGTLLNGNTAFDTNVLFVDGANNKVTFGSTASYSTRYAATANSIPDVQIHGVATDGVVLLATQWSNDVSASRIQIGKARGSVGTHGSLVDADSIGNIQFVGSDGTEFIQGAQIVTIVDGTPSAGFMPAQMIFRTQSGTNSTPSTRLVIRSSGNIGIANTAPVHTLSVNGTSYFGANTTLNAALIANNSVGTAGQVLTTSATGVYWAAASIPIVTTIATGTSISINAPATDVAYQVNTQAAGTLTINAPTGTLVDGEKLMIKIKSTNVQTFAWNAVFVGSNDVTLPTATTGGSKVDYAGFIYDTDTNKWHMIAKNFGF